MHGRSEMKRRRINTNTKPRKKLRVFESEARPAVTPFPSPPGVDTESVPTYVKHTRLVNADMYDRQTSYELVSSAGQRPTILPMRTTLAGSN